MAERIRVEEIWICPPLAFARFGQACQPMENFHWYLSNYSPRGTGETVIQPSLTFVVDANANISAYLPEEINFKDKMGRWHPVCPFFELHARLSDGTFGPLTINDLAAAGLCLGDITWKIEAANRKAYHYTLSRGDRVEGEVTVEGNDHLAKTIAGTSPEDADNPILPPGRQIPLGQVQVIRPNPTWPEIRLRITPPKGLVYAPTNLAERDLSNLIPITENQAEFVRNVHCILNPNAAWPQWQPNGDPRTAPGGLYPKEPGEAEKSLGFLDDSNDALITVEVTGTAVAGGKLTAYARYTCCPQDFQPDRRPFVSIADGLSNLVKREEVLNPDFVGGENWAETEREIADLMQRVRETMEGSNLDQQNLRSKYGNQGFVKNPEDAPFPFEPAAPLPGHPFPLTERGRMSHARFLAYQVFKQLLGQRPELFEQWIRSPVAEPKPYNTQMPALMRGSDSTPMYITQRQYYLMKEWLEIVKNSLQNGEEEA